MKQPALIHESTILNDAVGHVNELLSFDSFHWNRIFNELVSLLNS